MDHCRETKRCRFLWIGANERTNANEKDDESHEVNTFVDAGVHDAFLNVIQLLNPSFEESRREVFGCIHPWGLRRPRWLHRIRRFSQNT